jgi:hypothetical protein
MIAEGRDIRIEEAVEANNPICWNEAAKDAMETMDTYREMELRGVDGIPVPFAPRAVMRRETAPV